MTVDTPAVVSNWGPYAEGIYWGACDDLGLECKATGVENTLSPYLLDVASEIGAQWKWMADYFTAGRIRGNAQAWWAECKGVQHVRDNQWFTVPYRATAILNNLSRLSGMWSVFAFVAPGSFGPDDIRIGTCQEVSNREMLALGGRYCWLDTSGFRTLRQWSDSFAPYAGGRLALPLPAA